MTIELISKEQHEFLKKIQKEHPFLTFQNKGYQYIDKTKFTDEDKKAFDKVTTLLKKHITGFYEFNNFVISNKTKEINIRFQYNWTSDDEDAKISFVGVGYITIDELMNGFNDHYNIQSLEYVDDCMSINIRKWDEYMEGAVKANGSKIRKLIQLHIPELYASLRLDFPNPYEHQSKRTKTHFIYVHSGIEYFLKFEK
jgi:hypothetical protein